MNAGETHGVGRIALWVAGAALLAHAGLFSGGIWSFGAINFDDPHVLALLEQKTPTEMVTTTTWYAYKPVYFLSLEFDALFGAATVQVGHVINWLLHALAAFLLVKLLFELFGSRWIALAAGLLFAVHPAHVENVAWFSERKDTLSLVFVLLAHLAYRRARTRGRPWPWAAAGLLLLGGLTKGTVWSYVGVLVVDEWLFRRSLHGAGRAVLARVSLLRLTPLLVVGLGGVLLDGLVAAHSGASGIEHGVSTSALVAAMAGVHLRYLGHLLAPVGLALDYAIDPGGSWAHPLAWGGLLLGLAAVGALVVGIRRARPWLAWSAAFWIFGLAPVNNIWPRTSALLADRYLYVPAIGFYVLVAFLLRRAGQVRTVVLGIAVVALFALSEVRTATFASSEAVWSDNLDKVPGSALAHLQRGIDAVTRHEYARGLQDADAALALHPRPEFRVRARLLRCGALHGMGRIDELLTEANAATNEARALRKNPIVREDPRHVRAEAEIFRGQALEALDEKAAAEEAYALAVKLDPENWSAWFNYGTMRARSHDPEILDAAVDALRRARDLAPAQLSIDLQLATVYGRRGDKKRALAVLDRAQQKHGVEADLLYTRATVLLEIGNDWAAARRILRQLREVEPDHPKGIRLDAEIEVAIGRASLRKGRADHDRTLLKQAVDHFDAALRILPTHWQAEVFAGDAYAEEGRFRAARERYREARRLAPKQRWIAGMTARTAALEAAIIARYDKGPDQVTRAAKVMAAGLGLPDVYRIDLGFAPLEDELPLLRRLPPLLEAGRQPEAAHAAELLAAAALLVTGDELSALEKVQQTLGRLGGSERSPALLDTALVLRATLYERQTEFALARRDYETLRTRRPEDVLPPLRLLQIDVLTAEARRRTAAGHSEDAERLAAARQVVADTAARARAFADAHPESSSAGMLAVQAEIGLKRWIEALRRLNGLAERFPRNTSVYRGFNAVYLAWFIQTHDRELVKEASRALTRATDLDPRDARTALDASQLARVAGDLGSALKHAERARAQESRRGGPASRMLSDLHIALGYQALKGGEVERARQSLLAARRVDPKRAGSWILEGELALKSTARDRFVRAFDLARKAKELEPYDPGANKLMARCHKGSSTTALLQMGRYQDPPADAKGWDEARRARLRKARDRFRRQAIHDLEMALLLDPLAEDADDTRRTVKRLKEASPISQAERQARARAAYDKGLKLQVDTQYVDALYAFYEAVDQSPNWTRAHGRLLQVAAYLLNLLPKEGEEAQKTLRKYMAMAWRSLYVLEAIDNEHAVAELPYFRGVLNDVTFQITPFDKADAREVARLAALSAYRDFVLRMRAKGTTKQTSPPLRQALDRIEFLQKQGG